MKVKLLTPYDIDNEHTICKGAELEAVDSWCSCNGTVYVCVMPDGSHRPINGSVLEVVDYKPYQEWEMIRTQAAISAMQAIITANASNEMFVLLTSEKDVSRSAVRYADALINELRKKKKK